VRDERSRLSPSPGSSTGRLDEGSWPTYARPDSRSRSTLHISPTTRPTWNGSARRDGAGGSSSRRTRRFVANALELAAILASGVACFSLGHGNLKAEQMAQAFVAARRRMEKTLRRFEAPMTAAVTATGHVRVLMAKGQVLLQPREIK